MSTAQSHAVGIDLGTTYSCLAYLNEHGEPITLANEDGELATPSVVFFDGDQVIVGTEALRNAIVQPHRVVANSKRHIGDPAHRWTIGKTSYTPVDIAAYVLKKLLDTANKQIGQIERAVITVPAQFSEPQRRATIEAGRRAGLKHIDIINEPVAAALCYVLGTEGMWFTELADKQQILVYDLGGGTFDLSLVRYEKDSVRVIASSGELHLGGIDWNHALEKFICQKFVKDFDEDPHSDPQSQQALALEVETTKRSLTVRPRAALTCQHAGRRKTYQIAQEKFEQLTAPLVEQTAEITQSLLKDNDMGWAHVDVILTTGGASRMPMIREKLKEMGGTTLNTSLSPDQSIAHGATYYAGMLSSNAEFAKAILNQEVSDRLARMKQHSVNARALGILIQNEQKVRVPHYLIPSNTQLPTTITQTFGTVVPNQKRVHLQIVESPATEGRPHVLLGNCIIDDLSPGLPEGSEVHVTIRYDEQAHVHVSALDVTGRLEASTEIVRPENMLSVESASPEKSTGGDDFQVDAWSQLSQAATELPHAPDQAEKPVPLCDRCGEPLNVRGQCPSCPSSTTPPKGKRRRKQATNSKSASQRKRNSQGDESTPRKRNDKLSGSQKQSRKKKKNTGEAEFWLLPDS